MRARTARTRTAARRRLAFRAGAAVAAATVALTGPAAAEGGQHTVAPGETASEIARDNGTTLADLAAANGLADVDRIIVGQVLVIPSSTPAAPATVVHVVAPGETLGGIARRYRTSVAALAQANGVTNPNLVRIGQRLTVPASGGGGGGGGSTPPPAAAPAPVSHTVAAGENLASIAAHYGTTVGAIVAANGISNPNLVRIGQVLTIPPGGSGGSGGSGGGGGAAAAPAGHQAYAATGGADGHTGVAGRHTVASGESLAGIARRYGVSEDDLAAANGLLPPHTVYAAARYWLDAPNQLPVDLATCPVPGGSYVNDWGFPRSGGRAHEGNDVFAPRGTPVRAPAAGTVSYATGSIGGRQFRLVADDGTVYLGSHLDAFGTSGRVAPGDTVGYIGNSGNAAGSRTHVHFEVHPNGGPAMNPYPLLRFAC